MKIPINRLTKQLKLISSKSQCSTISTISLLLYVIFICFVLSITFPLRSTNSNDIVTINRNRFSVDEINQLTDDEQKFIDKANTVGYVENKNYMLQHAFKMTDLNGDSLLTLQELAKYINGRIRDHIELSIRNNPILFSEIDLSPRNGLVTWDEYYSHFLRTHGYKNAKLKPNQLSRRDREQVTKEKLQWTEAARTDSYSLTLDEFLAFKHPESSAANMLSLVDDLLRQFDEDGDENLTIDEFSEVVADDLDDKWRKYMIEKTSYQRQEEFKRLIDKNHDGIADRSELLSYVSPKHPRHALQEAATLFSLADKNKDHRLSMGEIEKAENIFLASRMIDSSQTFHDDF